MKKRNILFVIFSVLCLNLIAGCGETEYTINASSADTECGYVTGGGKYSIGDKVTLTVHKNLGCTFSKLGFTSSVTNVTSTVSNFNPGGSQNGYDDVAEYTFTVTEDNVGSFVFYFNNKTPLNSSGTVSFEGTTSTTTSGSSSGGGNGGGSSNPANPTTYQVNYRVYGEAGGSPLYTYTETVDYGFRPSKNYTYINTSNANLKNKKITWYVDSSFTTNYTGNESNTVYTLYGKAEEMTAKNLIDEIAKNLQVSQGVKFVEKDSEDVNYYKEATVVGLKDYYSTSKDVKKISITVNSNMCDGASCYLKQDLVLKDGRYDEVRYTSSLEKDIVVGFSLGNNTFNINQINDLYKFIEVADLNSSSYTDGSIIEGSASYTLENVKYEIGDNANSSVVIDKKYTLTVNGKNLSLYTYNGKLYKIENGTKTIELTYDDTLVADSLDGHSEQMYFVKLYTNIHHSITDINNNFDTILKVIPSRRETLGSALEKVELLKGYSYTVRLGRESDDDICNDPDNYVVRNHMDVYIDTGSAFTSVQDAINELFTVNGEEVIVNRGFNITTSIKNVHGFGARNYTITANTVITDLIADAENNAAIHPITLDGLKCLALLDSSDYTKLNSTVVGGMDKYSFFNKSYARAFLTVYIRNGKIIAFDYYDTKDNSTYYNLLVN